MAFDLQSPKDRFLHDKLQTEAHALMVANTQFEKSVTVALNQFQHEMALKSERDMNGAAAHQFMLSGAHQFVSLLRNLAERVETPKAAPMYTPLHKT